MFNFLAVELLGFGTELVHGWSLFIVIWCSWVCILSFLLYGQTTILGDMLGTIVAQVVLAQVHLSAKYMRNVCSMQRECRERCHIPVILAPKRRRQEGLQLKASLASKKLTKHKNPKHEDWKQLSQETLS